MLVIYFLVSKETVRLTGQSRRNTVLKYFLTKKLKKNLSFSLKNETTVSFSELALFSQRSPQDNTAVWPHGVTRTQWQSQASDLLISHHLQGFNTKASLQTVCLCLRAGILQGASSRLSTGEQCGAHS